MSLSVDEVDPEQDPIAPDLETVQADLERTLAELREEKAWTDHLLDAVVEGIITLDRHGQRLTVDLPAGWPLVQVDPRRIEQVLVNLLSNASKYGPDDAKITVSAAITADWIWVTVSDRGPGVSPEGRDALFRRFVRLDAGHRNGQVGMGLGLSVVKAIVNAHGGQVLAGVSGASAVGIVAYLLGGAPFPWLLAPSLTLGAVLAVPIAAYLVSRLSTARLTLAIGGLTTLLGGYTLLRVMF